LKFGNLKYEGAHACEACLKIANLKFEI